jgi:hypothetical protein
MSGGGGGGLPDGEWEGLVAEYEGGRRHEVDLDVAAAGQQTLQLGRLQATLNSKKTVLWIHEKCWHGSGSADPYLLLSTNVSGSCSFRQWPSGRQQKICFFLKFFA